MNSRMSSTIREDAESIYQEMSSRLELLNGTTMLLTGASGFLCSYLLEVLAVLNENMRPGCRVIALDNFRHGLPDRLEWISARSDIDFRCLDASQRFEMKERVDWIVHGASIASPPVYRKYPLETIDVNVNGTRHMLDLLRSGGSGMLLLSSSEIYGDPDPAHIPTSEDYRGFVSCTGPRACYDESKRLAETLAATYHRLYDVPVKTIRPFNVYGPGQRLDDGRIIPDLVSAVLAHRPIVLYSDGRATRSFCYASDAIRGMLLILLSDVSGEAFNVGNDEEISIADVARIAAELDGPNPLPIRFALSEDGDYLSDNPVRRCPDLRKLKSLGDWEPRVKVREGLARTLRSYRECGSRNPADMPGYKQRADGNQGSLELSESTK